MTTIGRKKFVFSNENPKPKPLKGWPDGRIRIRFRGAEFAKAFVKTREGIEKYYIEDDGEHWIPGPFIAGNITVK